MQSSAAVSLGHLLDSRHMLNALDAPGAQTCCSHLPYVTGHRPHRHQFLCLEETRPLRIGCTYLKGKRILARELAGLVETGLN